MHKNLYKIIKVSGYEGGEIIKELYKYFLGTRVDAEFELNLLNNDTALRIKKYREPSYVEYYSKVLVNPKSKEGIVERFRLHKRMRVIKQNKKFIDSLGEKI